MDSKENIQKELNILVNRWKGRVPTSFNKEWWKFKADRTLALRYRDQLAYYDTYLEREKKIEAEAKQEQIDYDKMEAIFK